MNYCISWIKMLFDRRQPRLWIIRDWSALHFVFLSFTDIRKLCVWIVRNAHSELRGVSRRTCAPAQTYCGCIHCVYSDMWSALSKCPEVMLCVCVCGSVTWQNRIFESPVLTKCTIRFNSISRFKKYIALKYSMKRRIVNGPLQRSTSVESFWALQLP